MDPLTALGAVASICQLASAALSISKSLYTLGDAISSASDDIKTLADDLKTFSQSLTLLSRLLEDSKCWYSDDIYLLTAKVIQDCTELYVKIDKVLVKLGYYGKSNWKLRVKFVYKEAQIRKLMKRLRDMKGTLATILMSLQVDLQLSLLNISSSSKIQRAPEVELQLETVQALKDAYNTVRDNDVLSRYGISSEKTPQPVDETPQSDMLPTGVVHAPQQHAISHMQSLIALFPVQKVESHTASASAMSIASSRDVPTMQMATAATSRRIAKYAKSTSTSKGISTHSIRSSSSIESFKTAVSVQMEALPVSAEMRAVQSVLYQFKIALQTLENLIAGRIDQEDEAIFSAARALERSFADTIALIEARYGENMEGLARSCLDLSSEAAKIQRIGHDILVDIVMKLYDLHSAKDKKLQASTFQELQAITTRHCATTLNCLQDIFYNATVAMPPHVFEPEPLDRRIEPNAFNTNAMYSGKPLHWESTPILLLPPPEAHLATSRASLELSEYALTRSNEGSGFRYGSAPSHVQDCKFCGALFQGSENLNTHIEIHCPKVAAARSHPQAANAVSQLGVDRNTYVRSTMTLPAYNPRPKAHDQVLGREGERGGIEVVNEISETIDEEEQKREEEIEMEALYQVRLARRREKKELEERRRLRREARDQGDISSLRDIQARARESCAGSSTATVQQLRAEHDRIRRERQRGVSSVSYGDLGIARHDGTRLRLESFPDQAQDLEFCLRGRSPPLLIAAPETRTQAWSEIQSPLDGEARMNVLLQTLTSTPGTLWWQAYISMSQVPPSSQHTSQNLMTELQSELNVRPDFESSLSLDATIAQHLSAKLHSGIAVVPKSTLRNQEILETRAHIVLIMKTVDQQIGLKVAVLGWTCVWKCMEIFNPVALIRSGLNSPFKKYYHDLQGMVGVIARYAVMENLYCQASGALALKAEYKASLLSLCCTILEYFATAFQLGRLLVDPGQGDNWRRTLERKCAKLLDQVTEKDKVCQGFRVVADVDESKSESDSESNDGVEDISDMSWEDIENSELTSKGNVLVR